MGSPVGEYLAVRDFEELRHYKNRRSLPWIKVEQVLLDDPSFLSVDATQRGLYLMLCLLAARLNNRILFEPVYLGRAMRLDGPVDVSPLIQAGLVQVIQGPSDSKREQTAIECEQSAVREYGDESTKKTNEENERTERSKNFASPVGGSEGKDKKPRAKAARKGATELGRTEPNDAMTPISKIVSSHPAFAGRLKPEDSASVQTSAQEPSR